MELCIVAEEDKAPGVPWTFWKRKNLKILFYRKYCNLSGTENSDISKMMVSVYVGDL